MSDGLERLWASWRGDYVASAAEPPADHADCVLCGVLALRHTSPEQLVYVGETAAVTLNAYPYTSGHVMVLPYAHVPRLADLELAAKQEMFDLIDRSVAAIESAYQPDGVNFGANVGRGSGAGIPEHLHVHALPRWMNDTNFMTTIGGARVVPEGLDTTLERLRAAFR